jgi:hypothetical protein
MLLLLAATSAGFGCHTKSCSSLAEQDCPGMQVVFKATLFAVLADADAGDCQQLVQSAGWCLALLLLASAHVACTPCSTCKVPP